MNKDVTFKLCGNCGDKVFFFKLGSCYTPRGGKHNQEDLKASPGFESKRIAQQFQVYQLYFWINHLILKEVFFFLSYMNVCACMLVQVKM